MDFNNFLNKATLNALLVAFANAKPITKPFIGFVIESSYKNSAYSPIELTDDIYQQNNQLLSQFTNLDFQLNGKKHQFFIQSDLSCDDFLHWFIKISSLKAPPLTMMNFPN